MGQFIATIEKNRFRFYKVLLVGLPVLAMLVVATKYFVSHLGGKHFRSPMALVLAPRSF